MNCKPGELAVLVRNTYGLPCLEKVMGTPLVCQTLARDIAGRPVWRLPQPIGCPSCTRAIWAGFYDADLQPMRPPSRTVIEFVEDEAAAILRGEVAHG